MNTNLKTTTRYEVRKSDNPQGKKIKGFADYNKAIDYVYSRCPADNSGNREGDFIIVEIKTTETIEKSFV